MKNQSCLFNNNHNKLAVNKSQNHGDYKNNNKKALKKRKTKNPSSHDKFHKIESVIEIICDLEEI